ncbi:MAG: hypothetical protein ABEH47_04210 [Haloferacaceae archaeon]
MSRDGTDGRGEALKGTLPAFVVGLAVVLAAGVLVGRFTGSHLAVAFAAYFLTTVYDLTVERRSYREALLDELGVGTGDGSGDSPPG